MRALGVRDPKILILTLPHGASHDRLANTLKKSLAQIQLGHTVQIVNALGHCAPWFRLYYNSYEILLKYWPSLWGWIENTQHESKSTNPTWLYRRGGKNLFRYIEAYDPDIVVATEVGLCELAALLKRESRARFCLVGAPTDTDFDQAWAQPEVDLFVVSPGRGQARLAAEGISPTRILPCGLPVDPAFSSLPDRATARTCLGLEREPHLLLVMFGGTGMGNARRILQELEKINQPLQVVFITGRNHRLKEELARLAAASQGRSRYLVLGWVNNIHEWMAASDLLVSKPGATTVTEAISSGLPLLALDPLPGDERRIGELIEDWGVGYLVRNPKDLAPSLARLLAHPEELQRLRQNALARARPNAARQAGEAILRLWSRS